MRPLTSMLAFIYFVSLVWVIPAIVYFSWEVLFSRHGLNVSAAMKGILLMVFWVVFGAMVLNSVLKSRINKIRKIGQQVAPENFLPRFEIFGLGTTEYFAVSPSTYQIVVVDLRRKVARCEPIDFVQTWHTQDLERQTVLTISFNCYEFSTISFRFGLRYCNDISAKLTLALSGPSAPVEPFDFSRLKH
jgi:hypothetical protein